MRSRWRQPFDQQKANSIKKLAKEKIDQRHRGPTEKALIIYKFTYAVKPPFHVFVEPALLRQGEVLKINVQTEIHASLGQSANIYISRCAHTFMKKNELYVDAFAASRSYQLWNCAHRDDMLPFDCYCTLFDKAEKKFFFAGYLRKTISQVRKKYPSVPCLTLSERHHLNLLPPTEYAMKQYNQMNEQKMGVSDFENKMLDIFRKRWAQNNPEQAAEEEAIQEKVDNKRKREKLKRQKRQEMEHVEAKAALLKKKQKRQERAKKWAEKKNQAKSNDEDGVANNQAEQQNGEGTGSIKQQQENYDDDEDEAPRKRRRIMTDDEPRTQTVTDGHQMNHDAQQDNNNGGDEGGVNNADDTASKQKRVRTLSKRKRKKRTHRR